MHFCVQEMMLIIALVDAFWQMNISYLVKTLKGFLYLKG